jgi:phosphoribosylglycinamide formyltransferase-1
MFSESAARLAVFVSGSGSNLQALIDATKAGILSARIVLVVSSRRDAYGLERAAKENIDTFVYKTKKYATSEDASRALLDKLSDHEVDYIALAGYLKLLPGELVRKYRNRVVNIHPALLPKYGGKGMYGHFVHEAVIASGDKESGVSVHLVDEIYDHGKVLDQVKVPVMPADTPDDLAARVLKQEHKLYARVLEKLIKGKYDIE